MRSIAPYFERAFIRLVISLVAAAWNLTALAVTGPDLTNITDTGPVGALFCNRTEQLADESDLHRSEKGSGTVIRATDPGLLHGNQSMVVATSGHTVYWDCKTKEEDFASIRNRRHIFVYSETERVRGLAVLHPLTMLGNATDENLDFAMLLLEKPVPVTPATIATTTEFRDLQETTRILGLPTSYGNPLLITGAAGEALGNDWNTLVFQGSSVLEHKTTSVIIGDGTEVFSMEPGPGHPNWLEKADSGGGTFLWSDDEYRLVGINKDVLGSTHRAVRADIYKSWFEGGTFALPNWGVYDAVIAYDGPGGVDSNWSWGDMDTQWSIVFLNRPDVDVTITHKGERRIETIYDPSRENVYAMLNNEHLIVTYDARPTGEFAGWPEEYHSTATWWSNWRFPDESRYISPAGDEYEVLGGPVVLQVDTASRGGFFNGEQANLEILGAGVQVSELQNYGRIDLKSRSFVRDQGPLIVGANLATNHLLNLGGAALIHIDEMSTLNVWEDLTNYGSIVVEGLLDVGYFKRVGDITVMPGGSIVTGRQCLLNTQMSLTGGALTLGQGMDVISGGALTGPGRIQGDIINTSGVIAASSMRGDGSHADGFDRRLGIAGNYTQGDAGTMEVRIAGRTQGDEYDHLAIDGVASLDGDLRILVVDSFMPVAGDSFDILDWGGLSGTFNRVHLPALGASLAWNTSQLYTSGVITVVGGLPGDFNKDGDVDGDDFLAWRFHFPTLTSATQGDGDADGDGNVDGDDFLAWQANFSPLVGRNSGASVPEPNTMLLALFTTALVVGPRRSAASRRRELGPMSTPLTLMSEMRITRYCFFLANQ